MNSLTIVTPLGLEPRTPTLQKESNLHILSDFTAFEAANYANRCLHVGCDTIFTIITQTTLKGIEPFVILNHRKRCVLP